MDNVSIKRTSILKDGKDIKDIRKDIEKIEYAYNMSNEGMKRKVIDEIYGSYYWINGRTGVFTEEYQAYNSTTRTISH